MTYHKDYLRDMDKYPIGPKDTGEDVNPQPGKCNFFEHRYKHFMCRSSPCVGLLQMTISTDSTQIQHCSVMDVQTHVAIKILDVFMSQETDL